MTEPIMIFYIFSNANLLFSYIGPGMGGGVIAAIFGIIAAFFLGLWGILYYPIKRAIKNKKVKKNKLKKKPMKYNILLDSHTLMLLILGGQLTMFLLEWVFLDMLKIQNIIILH